MLIEILSTFPHMYDSIMSASMMQRARDKGVLEFHAYDLRDWTHDKHRTTDDDPYGGGPGLVMKCEPIFEAVEAIAQGGAHSSAHATTHSTTQDDPYIIFLSPEGEVFTDKIARELSTQKRLLFVCGHYEGIDARAYTLANHTLSLGDYVLTSGELASMVVIDAIVRKLPGVLGAKEAGVEDESFASGLLEYPQYTRPANFRGMEVPEVLLSGNHQEIAAWRHKASLERTYKLRPDLLNNYKLCPADTEFLKTLS